MAKYNGIALETEYGVEVLDSSIYVQGTSSLKGTEGTEFSEDGYSDTYGEDAVIDVGVKTGGNLDLGLDLDSIGYLLYANYGNLKSEDGKHYIWGNGTKLPSLSILTSNGAVEEIFDGCMSESLDLKIDTSGKSTVSNTFVGRGTRVVGPSKDVSDLTVKAGKSVSFHEVQVKIDDALQVQKIKEFGVNVSTSLDSDTHYLGSRFIGEPFKGFRTTSITIVQAYRNADEINKFYGSVAGLGHGSPLPFKLEITITKGNKTLTIEIPKCVFAEAPEVNSDGRVPSTQSLSLKALGDQLLSNGEYGEILFTLVNNDFSI